MPALWVFFPWDISDICLTVTLKLAIAVFISLYFQSFWPKWPNFFRPFQKNYCLWPKKPARALFAVVWEALPSVVVHLFLCLPQISPGTWTNCPTLSWAPPPIRTLLIRLLSNQLTTTLRRPRPPLPSHPVHRPPPKRTSSNRCAWSQSSHLTWYHPLPRWMGRDTNHWRWTKLHLRCPPSSLQRIPTSLEGLTQFPVRR